MRITDMQAEDVAVVAQLVDQLHPDEPGVIDPGRIRQGWRAFVARDGSGEPVGFPLGSFTGP